MTRLKATTFEKITDSSYDNLFNYTHFKPLTRLLNALSLTFRVGERFFCSAVRLHNTQVSLDLQEEIKVFIRQEGQHSASHHSLNLLLQEKGVNVKVCEKQAEVRLQSLGMTPEQQLKTTVALEKLTALGGWLYILGGKFFFKDCQTSRLWKAHALEEVQHEFVAIDVQKQCYSKKRLKNFLHFFKTLLQLLNQLKYNYKVVTKAEELCKYKS